MMLYILLLNKIDGKIYNSVKINTVILLHVCALTINSLVQKGLNKAATYHRQFLLSSWVLINCETSMVIHFRKGRMDRSELTQNCKLTC